MVERHIDDRSIHDLDESREHDGQGDDPFGPFVHFPTSTVGSTDIPRRRACPASVSLSSTILTGTLCTTLTYWPVAFSGGKRENTTPVPAIMLSTVPLNTLSG